MDKLGDADEYAIPIPTADAVWYAIETLRISWCFPVARANANSDSAETKNAINGIFNNQYHLDCIGLGHHLENQNTDVRQYIYT